MRDSAGKVASVEVEVIPKKVVASIANIKYNSSISQDGMGGVYFEVNGVIKEVGLEYYLGTNTQSISKNLLSIEPDNVYSVVYDLQCPNTSSPDCKISVKPYVIDQNNNKVYASSSYYAVAYTNGGYGIASAGDENEDGIVEIASAENVVTKENEIEGVEINAVGLSSIKAGFTQIGESVVKKIPAKYRGLYDGSADAINDQLQDLKALLDTETYKALLKELKGFALLVVNGKFDVQTELNKIKSVFTGAYEKISFASQYLIDLPIYEKQYYSSYLGVGLFMNGFGPGKLKGVKALDKVVGKADGLVNIGKSYRFAKVLGDVANISKKIANGHASTKHLSEFAGLAITTDREY